MGTEFQGGTTKTERQTSKWYTIEKKDPAWYDAGIEKLIDMKNASLDMVIMSKNCYNLENKVFLV